MKRSAPALLLLALSGAFAADAPAPAPAPAPEELVRRLGDDRFQAREEAQVALEGLGEAARPALEEAAAKAVDAEIRARAKAVLARLDARKAPPAPRNPDEAAAQRLEQFFQQLQVAAPGQAGNARFTLVLNGKVVTLTEEDLKKLEALKGQEAPELGARVAPCPEELASQLGIPGGVLVRGVDADGPFPLELHDVLLRAGETPVASPEELLKAFEAKDPPKEVEVLRAGKRVVLKKRP